ncbi:MAG: hypothetical protein ACFE9W_14560 [Promethearchaeota archaeon]
MQGLDVAIASIVVACISVVVASVLAVLQLRHQSQTRQAQLFMNIYDEYYNPEWHRRWLELVYTVKDEELIDSDGIPTFLKGDIEKYVGATALTSFFEGIGLLVYKGLIDINLVAELMSTPLIFVWQRVEELVMRVREITGRPQVYEWFEYLYNEIQKIPSRQSQPSGLESTKS